jgi:hypothetical protein
MPVDSRAARGRNPAARAANVPEQGLEGGIRLGHPEDLAL